FSSFTTVEWARGPTQIAGFNYYPAVRISGEAKPGFTSGDAIAEMERLSGRLPRGFGYEWTGQSLQEKLSGSQAPFLLALSVFVVSVQRVLGGDREKVTAKEGEAYGPPAPARADH